MSCFAIPSCCPKCGCERLYRIVTPPVGKWSCCKCLFCWEDQNDLYVNDFEEFREEEKYHVE
jgi:hypothetical protein